ncbi:chaperone protein dnaJ 11, chloroplastic-like [Wolffia australiana]
MNAASSLSSSSSNFVSLRAPLKLSSRSPTSTVRSPSAFKISASYASATETEREGFRGSRNHQNSRVYNAGSLYEMLGLTESASAMEIKTAYRKLARACHPDAVAADLKIASAENFKRIHAAYATLSDPDKRAEYDRRIVPAPARWTSPVYGYPPPSASTRSSPSSFRFTRRTWETDQCW